MINCDQCRSTVHCCFTFTETVRLIQSLGVGQKAQDSHLNFHTAPELYGGGGGGGERGRLHTCHHQNDFCIKVGSNETDSHFNVPSL